MSEAVTEEALYDAYAGLNDTYVNSLKKKVRDLVDVWLMMNGDVKEYRDVIDMARVLTDSVVLWSVAEGYLSPTDKSRATAEEKAKNLEADQATVAEPSAARPGAYL